MANQVLALLTSLQNVGYVPAEDATNIVQLMLAGPWTAEQKATLATAVGELSLRNAAPGASQGNRPQQRLSRKCHVHTRALRPTPRQQPTCWKPMS